MSSQKEAKDAVLGHWSVMPPLGNISKAAADGKTRKVDPGPGIIQTIAAIAASPILSTIQQRPPSSSSSEDSHDSEDAAAQSSGWESEDSEEIEVTDVVMDADTGDATFATL